MEEIKKALNSYNTILKVIEKDNQILTNERLKHLKKQLQQAMNYIPCCKSDSELLSCETCKFNCDDWDDSHPCANCAGFEFWEAT